MHLQHPVHLLHRRARAVGDADLALRGQDLGLRAFLGRHRSHDRVEVDQHLVVGAALRHRRLRLLEAGDHARERAEAAHAAHLIELRAKIVEVELTLRHLLRHRLGLFGLDRLGGAFDEADDVAHAEDAAGDARGLEELEPVELFTRTRELDRLSGDRAHRQRGAAARVAVHAGQHDAGQRHLFGKALRDLHRVLAGQAVDDEQGFGRVRRARYRLHLVHQLLVDVETARGVEHQHVIALQLRRLHRTARDLDRLLTRDDRQGRDVDLRTEHRKLFLRGGAIDVERRHQHLLALFFLQPLRDLRGRRGLARALQADHHDHGGGGNGKVELGGFGAEHFGQRVADDLDHLLPRGDRAQDILTDREFGDLIDEAAHDGQRDVGLEQGDSHFAHRRAHVGLGQRAAAAELPENIAKPIAQTVEHAPK